MQTTMETTFDKIKDFGHIFDQSHELLPPPRKNLSVSEGGLSATFRLKAAYTSLHPMLPDTPVWAYDGLVPGPTVVVQSGDHVYIRVKNRITSKLPYAHVVMDEVRDPSGGMNDPGAEPNAASTDQADQEEQQAAADLDACCVMHLHGAPTAADSDGWAENVIMSGETADHHYQFKRETFRTASDGEHPAFERRGGAAPMFWYHDHAMGATRFNNYAGLAGAWIVRDEIEELIGLPTDESYEVPLILQDRNLDTSDGGRHSALNGKLLHKVQAGIRECFGPATLVSGKLWPRMSVDPCVYRLRILNGSNARYFRLNFFGVVSKDDPPPYTQLSAEMVQQIGTDGGLLAEAIDLPANGLVVAPAERADVLIDFGLIAEKYSHVILLNDAPAPYGNDPPPAAHPEQEDLENLRPVPHVMRFDLRWDDPICGLNNAPIQRMALDPDFEPIPSDHHELPHHEHSLIVLREEDEILRNSDGIPVDRNGNPAFDANGQPIKDADGNPVQFATRTMLFLHEMLPEQEASRAGMNMFESVDEFGTRRGIRLALNESNSSTVYVTASKRFDDATNIVIEKGAWHLWKILNLSPDSHPFHIHLTQLQAIQHRSFQPTSGLPIKADSAEFSLTEISLPDPINPPGWKDTFRISPGERGDSNEIKTAEMMVLFGQFSQHAGRYMYHCHILEHEDSDMMRPFVVAPSGLMGLMGHMGMSH